MRNRNKGFTLIEILIATTILAFMSIFLAESISSGVKTRKKIKLKIDRESAVRDSLNIIARDVQMAFNYRDINIDLYNEAQKERIKNKNKKKTTAPSGAPPTAPTTPTTPTQPEEIFKPKEQKIVTQFQGSKDSLHFTAYSNVRTQKDQQVSDQAEVGYYLETCKGRLNKKHSSKCLFRRLSPIIDDKTEEGGGNLVLLENVTKLSFKYLAPTNSDEPEWREDWFSGEGADDVTRGRFPSAVEITLEIQNKQNKTEKPFAMTRVTQLRFSNNYEPPKTENSPSTEKGTGL